MAGRSILFIGGTGVISSACVTRALERGDDVTLLTRGRRPAPNGARAIHADIRDEDAARAAIGDAEYDVVAEFVAFTPDHVRADLDLFEGRCGQYLFVSSASAYQKPPLRLPVTESTPLRNPFWQYSRDKIACEDLLVAAYRDRGFPITIVRPSHTYDQTLLPTLGHWTDIARLRAGRPVVVHGDGTSLWTITHSSDVAVGLVGLMGHPAAIGEAFTLTGDHAPTWNQIYGWLAQAAGVDRPDLVHVASDTIARAVPALGPTLLGDKAHSMVFDCSKAKSLVPGFGTTITFDRGASEIVDHFDRHPELQTVDRDLDLVFDRLVAHRSAF